MVIEVYFTLYYSIRRGNIGFLKKALYEITIIFNVPTAKKLKYAKKILCQIHILNTTTTNQVL